MLIKYIFGFWIFKNAFNEWILGVNQRLFEKKISYKIRKKVTEWTFIYILVYQ